MKRIIKIIGVIILALLVAVGGYVAYVFIDYDRIADNVELDVEKGSDTASSITMNGQPLRISSYNIGFGAYSDDYSFFMDGGRESRARSEEAVYQNVGGAMDQLSKMGTDIVLLQEVDEDGTRSYHIDERDIVKESFGAMDRVYAQNYDSPYLMWPLTEPHGANKAGQMTMADFAIDSSVRRSLPIEDGFMKLVDLDRCYSVSRIPCDNGKELVIYNFHLSAYTSDGKIAEDQLKMLFADMEAERDLGNYTIAGGDFNKDILGNSSEVFRTSGEEFTWAQPVPEELIPEDMDLIAPFNEEDPVASCRNADRPYGPDNYLVTVDGFIVSDNVDVASARVIDTGFRWSDHNPVYMDFILR